MLDALILVLICILSYYLKRSYFNLPLDRDYGGHGYVAYSWLHKRGLMYRDIYESKTPLLKIIYIIIFKIYGITRIGFRKFLAQYTTLSILTLYCVGLLLDSSHTGLIMAGLFGLASCIPSLWWHFSNTESYYILPTSLSFLFLVLMLTHPHSSITHLYTFLAGLFCAIAFMFKQPALINTGLPQFIFLSLPPVFSIITVSMYLAGFAIPFALFFIYFVIIHKTPITDTPFGIKLLKIIRQYHASPLFKKNPATTHYHRIRLKGIFTDCMLLIVFGIIGSWCAFNTGTPQHALMLMWLGCAIVSIIISRTYLPYHFIPLIAPLSILSGIAIANLFAHASHVPFSQLNFYGIGALLVLSCFFLYQLINDLLVMPHVLIGNFYSGEDGLYTSCEDAGNYIKAHSTPDDYVYSWGHEATIYLWSQRRCPSRMIFPPVMNPSMFSKDQVAAEYSSLIRNMPKFFVITSTFDGFKEFEMLVSYNYVLDKKFEPGVYVFKRREQAQPIAPTVAP